MPFDQTRLDELLDRQGEVEREIADIKAQLETAQAHRIETGEYANPDWFRRAKAALRFRGVEHQRLQRTVARMRDEYRKELLEKRLTDK